MGYKGLDGCIPVCNIRISIYTTKFGHKHNSKKHTGSIFAMGLPIHSMYVNLQYSNSKISMNIIILGVQLTEDLDN